MRFWQYSLGLLIIAPWAGFALARVQRPSVYECMQRAMAAVKAGRFDEAEATLRRVIARDSGNAVARVRLAEIALQQNDISTSLAAVQAIADTDGMAVRARLIEGESWFRQNRLVPAESCWVRARRLDPKNPSARMSLSQLYGTQLRDPLWNHTLWEAYDIGQAGLEEMIQLMLSGLHLRNFGASIPRLRAAIAADPGDRHTRRALGLHLLRVGQTQDALRELAELHDRYPDDGNISLALMDCLIACSDREKLGDLLNRSSSTLHEDWRFWHARGCLALLDDTPQAAIEPFRRALHITPYATDVHVRMAEAIRLSGNDMASLQPHHAIMKETAKIEQLAPMLHTNGWDLDLICQLVRSCEKLLLIEEALGWVQVGLSKAPADPFLLEARARLVTLPRTSSRNPPTWETLEQSVSS